MTEQNNNRKAANLFDSAVFLALVIGSVILVNVILALPSTPPMRVDLTDDGIYTLSQASKDMVGELEEEVLIKFFVSENLQYPDHNLEQRVRDLLSEYEVNAKGKLNFEIVHPESAEEGDDAEAGAEGAEAGAEEEVAEDDEGPKGFGCQKIPMGVRGQDEVALRLVFKCLALVYGDQTQVINDLKGNGNLEYEISKRIKVLTTPEEARHVVGFVTGFGGPADQQQFIQSISQGFSEIYGDLITARAVDLASKRKVADDVDALVIINPNKPFSPDAQYAVDQFLMAGKGVAWLQTSLAPNPQMPMLPMRQQVSTGLNPLFEAYGLRLNQDLVLDRANSIVSLALTERGLAQVSNPTMPVLTDINTDSVITKDIPTLSFPLASTITVMPAALESEALQVIELVKTEKEAVRRANASDISYETIMEPQEGEEAGPFVVAAALQGPMKSFFADKDKPSSSPASNPSDDLPKDYQTVKESSNGARIIVVANGDFMFPNPQTGYGRQYSGLGALFLLNMVDWLVQDEALVTIRSKGVPRVLKDVSPESYSTYQAANIIGVPAIFALIGLLFWFLRRQRQQALKL